MTNKQVKVVQLVGMLLIIAGIASIFFGWRIDENAANRHNAGATLMPLGWLSVLAGIIVAGIGSGIAWWRSE